MKNIEEERKSQSQWNYSGNFLPKSDFGFFLYQPVEGAQYQKKLKTDELDIKLRHYEEAAKSEKISNLFWQNSCFYSVGDFLKF